MTLKQLVPRAKSPAGFVDCIVMVWAAEAARTKGGMGIVIKEIVLSGERCWCAVGAAGSEHCHGGY